MSKLHWSTKEIWLHIFLWTRRLSWLGLGRFDLWHHWRWALTWECIHLSRLAGLNVLAWLWPSTFHFACVSEADLNWDLTSSEPVLAWDLFLLSFIWCFLCITSKSNANQANKVGNEAQTYWSSTHLPSPKCHNLIMWMIHQVSESNASDGSLLGWKFFSASTKHCWLLFCVCVCVWLQSLSSPSQFLVHREFSARGGNSFSLLVFSSPSFTFPVPLFSFSHCSLPSSTLSGSSVHPSSSLNTF